MKKKILALLMLMLMCVFSLTACVETEETVTDTTIVETLTSSAESLVGQIVEMDDATLELYIEEYYGVDGMTPNAGLLSGLQSWESNKEDLGAFVSFDSCKVVYDSSDHEYTAIAQLTFEKRACEFKLMVDRQMSGISTMTFNPEFTFGETMTKAAMNTLMGIGTVFFMLIAISGLIYCFKFIHIWEEKRNSKAAAAAQPAPAPVAAPVEEVVEEDLTDDLELIAVITAAIAASEGTSTDGLVVRSIKRAGTSKWKRA